MEKQRSYLIARGPESLQQVLSELFDESTTHPALKAQAHYVLYELGNQKSMIKVDMSVWPVIFWHYDLLGRPATRAVKEALSRVIWEKGGEKEWYFKVNRQLVIPQDEEAAYVDWYARIFEAPASMSRG